MGPGLTTQDIRSDARELKFTVESDRAATMRDWARAHLTADPHGSGDHGDEYRTSSLYFDTDGLDVFHRRRSFGRSKYRIRRYGSSDVVFLERKMRTKELLSKRRTIVGLDELPLVVAPGSHRDWTGRWFRRRLDARRLHVKAQVWYHRTARVGVTPYGTFRLTIDAQIEAAPATELTFAASRGVEVLTSEAIVELKFRHEMPALFKRFVEEFSLTPRTISKYRIAMTALGEAEESAVSSRA